MNEGNPTKKTQSGKEPSVLGIVSYVRCAAFRCLAYHDPEGHWRCCYNHEFLPEVLEVLSDTPESFFAKT